MTIARPDGAAEALRDLDALRAQLADAPDADRLHPVGLGGVLIGSGVLEQVGAVASSLCRDGRELVLLADARPMPGPSGELKETVQGLLAAAGRVRRVTIGDERADVHADAATLELAVQGASGAGLLVTVGSGTLTDIGKHVSAQLDGVPHVVVQTAASVNGYADDQSVLVIDGVKRTTQSRWPDRLIIDTGVIARAPARMNQSGLGDLLATYTAPADWLLAGLVGQDASFSEAVVSLARSHVDEAVDAAGGLRLGEPAAVESLSAALTLSGLSMGAAGRTAPGSGMEHTASHLLEMTEHGEPTLHGAKVGILSVVSAALWQDVRRAVAAGALRDLSFPPIEEMRERVNSAFAERDRSGAMAAECWRDYERKLERWHAARDQLARLPERWPAFEAQASKLLAPPERLLAALQRAGAPTRLSELGIEPDRARWAIANCHLMRDRFTVADLAFFLGLWDAAEVDSLLRQVDQLGGGL
jgi:glycerol-1-phosphate dehydrogenase [NAD(P)+]